MYKRLLVIVFILVQSVWSIRVIESKEEYGRWYVRFLYVPATEKIGAFKVNIRIADEMDITTVITDAPSKGAWSQIQPELSRKENSLQVLCVGPAMLGSRVADTVEMFNVTLEMSASTGADFSGAGVIDSIWFDECIDIQGSDIVPFMDHTTSSPGELKKHENGSATVRYRDIGRIYSLTFNLAGPEMVRARVVDMKGGVICRLVDRRMESGMHTLRWPENGRGIAPGTYFIQLEINSFTYHKKVAYYR